MSAPLLSICIPTYNHGDYVVDTVREMLMAFQTGEVEIVVSDNASTDGTREGLAAIADPRLKVFRNACNTGSGQNWLTVLGRATGKYAMLWLDREIFVGGHASEVCDRLRTLDAAAGVFVPNLKAIAEDRVIANAYEILKEYGIRIGHPTGYFFKVADLRALGVLERLRAAEEPLRTFLPESLVGALAPRGPFAVCAVPLVEYRLPPFKGTPVSYTYNTGNYWFLPERMFAWFMIYLRHIRTFVDLPIRRRFRLYRSFLRQIRGHCVERYLSILATDYACDYYGIPKSVRIRESRRWLRCRFVWMVVTCAPGCILDKVLLLLSLPHCRERHHG